MNIVVVGAAGQLGRDLVEVLSQQHQVIPLTRAECDLADPHAFALWVRHRPVDFVLHCAAVVRVDDCEDQVENTFQINALGTLSIARACRDKGIPCGYISTDYVFDGEKGSPYQETDHPQPLNIYGTSKLMGEYLLQQTVADSLIIRVSSVFGPAGSRGKGGNFLETILTKAQHGDPLTIVADQIMSPTYTWDAAQLILTLINQGVRGIVHGSNQGSCSWYTLACTALKLLNLQTAITAVPMSDFPVRARRPRNSALFSPAWGSLMPPWEDAVRRYLIRRGYLS